MLGNNNTQEKKSIQAIKLSDAKMEKVSGGSDYDDDRYRDGYRDGYDDGYRRFDRYDRYRYY